MQHNTLQIFGHFTAKIIQRKLEVFLFFNAKLRHIEKTYSINHIYIQFVIYTYIYLKSKWKTEHAETIIAALE